MRRLRSSIKWKITASFLEKEYGFKIVHLRVDTHGFVDVDQLELVLSPDVAMVTCMLANN